MIWNRSSPVRQHRSWRERLHGFFWGSGLRKVLSVVVLSRFFIFVVGIFSIVFLPKFAKYQEFSHSLPVDMWIRHDALKYLAIADKGYSFYNPGQPSSAGWFPLYPSLIRAGQYVLDPAIAGIITSHVALIVAMLLLYRLLRLDLSRQLSYRTILYMLVFPASIFFSSIHSESLFLALSVGSFYAARRGGWGIAGTLGFLASLTRAAGILLLPALFIEYCVQKGFIKGWTIDLRKLHTFDCSVGWLALIPAGTMLFGLFLYRTFGNVFAYIDVQVDVNRTVSLLATLLRGEPLHSAALLGVPYLLFAVALLYFMRTTLRQSYVVYTLLSLMLPLYTSFTLAMYRYMIVVFPLFMMLAIVAARARTHRYVTVGSIILLVIYMVGFVNGATFVF